MRNISRREVMDEILENEIAMDNSSAAMQEVHYHQTLNDTWLVKFDISPSFRDLIKYYNVSINGKVIIVVEVSNLDTLAATSNSLLFRIWE
jgi:hypothetical protein